MIPGVIGLLGRAGLGGSWDSEEYAPGKKRPSSMVDLMPQSEEEMEAIRNAVIMKEGLLISVFDLLRRMPRRVLMLLKLNDLVRCVLSFFPVFICGEALAKLPTEV